jgi:ABC-type antimicrobial peptide transport system permease subunit
VSQDVPDRPASGGLIQALSVPRNATIGLAVGLLLAVGAYLVRVLELLGPFAGTRQYPGIGAEGYFAMLAFVLATATALLVTALLTIVSAYRLTRELE